MTINTSTAINLSTTDIPSKQFSKTTSIINKHKFRNFIPMISNPEALAKILNRNKSTGNAPTTQAPPDFLSIEKLSELFQSTTIKSKYIKEIIEEYKSITELENYIKIVYNGKANSANNLPMNFLSDKKIVDVLFSKNEQKTAQNANSNNGQSTDAASNVFTAINETDNSTGSHSKAKPGLSTIQIINPDLRACLKHSEELSVFFNLINTLDMSMAVPYLNIKFFLPASYKTGGNNGEERNYAVASFNNFFFGYSGEKGQIDERFTNYAKAINGDYYLNKYKYQKPVKPNIVTSANQDQSQANQTSTPALNYVEVEASRKEVDISMFTMPQSLVNGDEKLFGDYNAFTGDELTTRLQPIQDKFRPFMSIESIDFDVRPTKELMSFKTATLNMVLYDKSRLNEVLSFVKPDLFGSFGSEILLQYGWQHVLGDPEYTDEMELSPIAEFINSLKSYEKYQIVNSSYSIQENGQVNITLNISMKGPAEIRGTKVDLNVFNYILTKQISLYVLQLQRAGLTDVSTGERHLSFGETDISLDSLNLGTITQLKTAFQNLHKRAQETFSKRAGALAEVNNLASRINATIDRLGNELTRQDNDTNRKLSEGILSFLDSAEDPYLNFEKYKSFNVEWEGFKLSDKNQVISLGKILLGILGKLVVTSYQYDEVQLVFFNLNEKAIRARGLNIAEIPVNKENFKKWFQGLVKNTQQISVEGLVSIILRRYVNEKASEVYGLNKWLKLTENSETKYIFENDQKKGQSPNVKAQIDVAQYQASILNEIKNQYYGEAAKTDDINQFDLTFKLPIVRMTFDTLIHEKNDERTILRINFYDENDNPYESMFDLLGNFQNDQLKSKISEINYLINQHSVDTGNKDVYKKRVENLITQLKELGIIKFFGSNGQNAQSLGEATSIKIEATSELTKNRSLNSLKTLFKELLPSITFGAPNSAAISANVSSMQDAKLSTVFMTRDEENSAKSLQYQMFENQNLLPTRIIPSQVSAKIIGCPIINFGQMIFFDFNTNTTVDNAYVVTGIKHSISPGKFETDLTLTLADGYAKFLANSSTIKSFIEIARNLKENQGDQDALNTKRNLDRADAVKEKQNQIEEILNKTGNYLFRISII